MIKVVDKSGNEYLSESIRSFLDEMGMKNTDGTRKSLRQTKQRGSFYKGYKVIENDGVTPKHLEGGSERKPKFEDDGDEYVIHIKGRRPLVVTKDTMRDFMISYCVHRLTINEMGEKYKLVREEIIAIKTAFGITKDSTPFIQDDIDIMTPDEMGEIIRIEKKRAFRVKFEKRKHDDMEKELKRFHKGEWMVETFIEELKSMDFQSNVEAIGNKPYKKYLVSDRREMVVPLADLHVGMVVRNAFNEYNFEIAKERINVLAEKIKRVASDHDIDTVYLEGLGDFVHGGIHKSIYKESEFAVPIQAIKSGELICSLVNQIAMEVNVKLTLVAGNHDRIEESKNANSKDDNWVVIIRELLKHYFRNVPYVEILENPSTGLAVINMFDYCIASYHGHELKTPQKVIGSMMNRGVRILEVHRGHFHSKKEITTKEGILEVTFPSFCGVDVYAETHLYSGEAYIEIRIYNKDGLCSTETVKFK